MRNEQTDAALELAQHEIHSTIWKRFIDKNNIMLDYADLEGNLSLPTAEECERNQPNALG